MAKQDEPLKGGVNGGWFLEISVNLRIDIRAYSYPGLDIRALTD